jgi:hypothetical protein
MTAVVFLGPTLSRRDAEQLLDAVILPPAGQGDVLRAVRAHQPTAVGLIDGAFAEVRAVWHREILWALSQGVHVFGGASMGALRAVELAPFGMRGVGAVYSAYQTGLWPGCDEPFEDDDEVAVTHAPVEAGGGALSDAMVDLRETLLAAEAAGVIDRGNRDGLSAAMKRLPFGARSFDRLIEIAADSLDATAANALARWLEDNRVYRKRQDAVELLQEMARFLANDSQPFAAPFRMERALVWEQFVAQASRPPPPSDAERMVLDELRLDAEEWRASARLALGRINALAKTDQARPGDVAERVDAFRRAHALWYRADLDSWLADNALHEAGAERLFRDETRLEMASRERAAELDGALLDHLRLSGRFAPLLQRAVAKQAHLATDTRAPSGLLLATAIDWYFGERTADRRPRSLAEYAARLGWADQPAFEAAVWREYRYEAHAENRS